MLSIAVCDDEILDCCKIAGAVKKILEEAGVSCIVRQFNSGQEVLKAIEGYDIIFLDILMSGLDGMKTARLLREKAFDKIIVFISSSREYVFEAYDVEAFHYLVKPVDAYKLKNILKRAVKKLEHHREEFLIVNKERQRKKFVLDDIYYFEIHGRIVSVHCAEGIFDFYEQMGNLERNLKGKGFCRCHKSFLVNLGYVDSYNRQEILLDNGEKVPIAKRRYTTFCNEILEFMKKRGGDL